MMLDYSKLPEICIPEIAVISRQDVFGDSNKCKLYCNFVKLVCMGGHFPESDTTASESVLTYQATPLTMPAGIWNKKKQELDMLTAEVSKYREREEKAYRNEQICAENLAAQVKAFRDSCLFGQACYNAYISNLYRAAKKTIMGNDISMKIPLSQMRNMPPDIEDVEDQLELMLEIAKVKGKTVSPDIFN